MKRVTYLLVAIAMVMGLVLPAYGNDPAFTSNDIAVGSPSTTNTFNRTHTCDVGYRVTLRTTGSGYGFLDSTGNVTLAATSGTSSASGSWTNTQLDGEWHEYVTPFRQINQAKFTHAGVWSGGDALQKIYCTTKAVGKYGS